MDSVHVEFHIDDDKVLNKVLYRMDTFIDDHFEDAKRVHLNTDSIPSTIIYRISKPVIKSYEENSLFFNNLNELFDLYADYTPHFTQFKEFEDNGGV